MIEARTRTVYFSPAAGKHFMTLNAAAHKEASVLMESKYPRERSDEQYAGWHWSNEARLVAIHARLKRHIVRRFRLSRPLYRTDEGSQP